MDTKWTGAIVTIVCAVIGFGGGMLGQKFTTERSVYLERLDNINALRSETYVNFFAAMAKLEQARDFGFENYGQLMDNRPDNDELAEKLETLLWAYHTETKEARMRLAAFAPTDMVHRLADYYRERFPQGPCDNSWKRDVQTYLALRRELLVDIEQQAVAPEQLFLLMWNCDPDITGTGQTTPKKE
ncbi:MAG: hypothetical protein HKM93_00610 [Desulfobacteraceae bacterium]|nr:hypothetical protein [Desulfobacteraceae bacterium]